LRPASFNEGSLRGAWLNEAHLERASRGKARLDEALVDRAHLEGAWLSGASFYGASLSDTQLVDALLDMAFLGKAESLAQTQLEAAWGEDTTLPDGYTRPRSEQWLPKVFDMDNLDDRWGYGRLATNSGGLKPKKSAGPRPRPRVAPAWKREIRALNIDNPRGSWFSKIPIGAFPRCSGSGSMSRHGLKASTETRLPLKSGTNG
jgi:hypothetical protein